ncbi:MAG: TetR/AcrR family transcriptional regulator [Nitrososphaerota archaeon]
MERKVKSATSTRGYDATRRQQAAQRNRHAIAEQARRIFVEQGYHGATMAGIARAAGVSHETVYAMFGPKPALFRHLIETALSGVDEPIPALEREAVRQARAEPSPARTIELFAHIVRQLHQRLAPLFAVLTDAARSDADLRALADELNARRVGHTRIFVEELRAKHGLRDEIPVELATDMFWAMNSTEFYLLFVRDRGWSPEAYEVWLAETWKRLLLPYGTGDAASPHGMGGME